MVAIVVFSKQVEDLRVQLQLLCLALSDRQHRGDVPYVSVSIRAKLRFLLHSTTQAISAPHPHVSAIVVSPKLMIPVQPYPNDQVPTPGVCWSGVLIAGVPHVLIFCRVSSEKSCRC